MAPAHTPAMIRQTLNTWLNTPSAVPCYARGALLKNYTDIGRFAIGRTKKIISGIGEHAVGMFAGIKKPVWDKKDEAVDAVKGTLGGMLGGTRKIFSNILEDWLNFGDKLKGAVGQRVKDIAGDVLGFFAGILGGGTGNTRLETARDREKY